jgi:hypothetical protein
VRRLNAQNPCTDIMSGNEPVIFDRIPDDQRLIEECSIYAQSLAAFDAGISADPNENKVENVGRHADRAAAALEKITAISPKTAEGLQAKAGIVAMVIGDANGELQERDEKFFLSLAADVKTFLQPTIDEHARNTLERRGRRTLWSSLTRGRRAWHR